MDYGPKKIKQSKSSTMSYSKLTYCQKLKNIMCNGTFLLVLMTLTILFYIVTGIQYWVTDYMLNILKQEKTVVFICYAVVTITGPVLGTIVGGSISSCLGGYQAKKSVLQTLAFTYCCLIFAIPIPLISNFPAFLVLLWFLLFFGGSILPSLAGVLLSCVGKQEKVIAQSFAMLIYNLLGYLPSPIIYGIVSDSGGGGNGRYAMGALLYSALIPVTTFSLAVIFIFKYDKLDFKGQEKARLEEEEKNS